MPLSRSLVARSPLSSPRSVGWSVGRSVGRSGIVDIGSSDIGRSFQAPGIAPYSHEASYVRTAPAVRHSVKQEVRVGKAVAIYWLGNFDGQELNVVPSARVPPIGDVKIELT